MPRTWHRSWRNMSLEGSPDQEMHRPVQPAIRIPWLRGGRLLANCVAGLLLAGLPAASAIAQEIDVPSTPVCGADAGSSSTRILVSPFPIVGDLQREADRLLDRIVAFGAAGPLV